MKVRATVICELDRHVLLVRKPKCRWSLPGGKVEPGETWHPLETVDNLSTSDATRQIVKAFLRRL